MFRSRLRSIAASVVVLMLLCACAPGTTEQGQFRDAANRLTAPEHYSILDEPTPVCPALDAACDDPAVIASWSPPQGRVNAIEYCTAFIEWASAIGITKVFVQRELDWKGWYERGVHAIVNAGGVPTGGTDAAQTVTDCAVAVQRTLTGAEEGGAHERFDIIGITGVPGVAGGLLVARLMPPRAIDTQAIRDTPEPYMIVVYLTLL